METRDSLLDLLLVNGASDHYTSARGQHSAETLLAELDQLHARLRFYPNGISQARRAQLREHVAQWLAAYGRELPTR